MSERTKTPPPVEWLEELRDRLWEQGSTGYRVVGVVLHHARQELSETGSRWAAFSEDELSKLRAGLIYTLRNSHLGSEENVDVEALVEEVEHLVGSRAGVRADDQQEQASEDDPELKRWEGFSNEELATLCNRLFNGLPSVALARPVATRLWQQADRERERRREQARPTYRGCGYYRHVNGTTLHVVGRARLGEKNYALVGESLDDPALWGISVVYLNQRDSEGRRLYEFSEVGS